MAKNRSVNAPEADRNPFEPPGALVADAANTGEESRKPPQVMWAVRLLWVMLFIAVVRSSTSWKEWSIPALQPYLQMKIAGLVAAALLIWILSRGFGWARWLY